MTANDPHRLSAVLLQFFNTPAFKVLVLIFFVAQLINLAILPAALETLKSNIAAAQAITAQATAAVTELRQKSEAEVAVEEARSKAETAKQAERLRQALARKTDEEAKRQAELARTSPQVQAAEKKIAEQKAAIAGEQAKHEERRARAEADKTAAEADLSRAEGAVLAATIQATTIKERAAQLQTCIGRIIAERTNRAGNSTASPCGILDFECDSKWHRENCLKE